MLCLPEDAILTVVLEAVKMEFDGAELEGFNIYSLIMQLAEMIKDVKQKIEPF